ncbi:hypothetical protein RchiOBHm_Chr4g0420841 [Rosa chinensis]|uniref:Uncharacterized protein n=1 Tax=Rosa chinensis TaxID=74649 RepID=A0A2P6QXY0_ROSCH|nr:hypothetical protein RchiOBHm_Chr4g0420841 [Rosa chinensis]
MLARYQNCLEQKMLELCFACEVCAGLCSPCLMIAPWCWMFIIPEFCSFCFCTVHMYVVTEVLTWSILL